MDADIVVLKGDPAADVKQFDNVAYTILQGKIILRHGRGRRASGGGGISGGGASGVYLLKEFIPVGPAHGDLGIADPDAVIADGIDLVQHDDKGFMDPGIFSGG